MVGFGGDGGGTLYGKGGDGGSVTLNNVVGGSTTGPLVLSQTAFGGSGGSSGGGFGAFGGGATSILSVANGTASSITGTVQSTGGGGNYSISGTGNGGAAVASIALTSTRNGVDVTATAIATGGAVFKLSPVYLNGPTGGSANATASASAVGPGVATANATASGTGQGAAVSNSTSINALGQSIVASATSPVGGPASAFTQTTISGAVSLPNSITPGQSYSVVNAFASGPLLTLAQGAMGAGYGGTGESLTYQESADFQLSGHGTIRLGFLNTMSVGNGFDSSTFQIFVNGDLFLSQAFSDLASANSFFTHHIFDLGDFSGGDTDIDLVYNETMSSAAGFGFTYGFAAGAVPEPSTWAMMLIGFAGLGFIFCHRKRNVYPTRPLNLNKSFYAPTSDVRQPASKRFRFQPCTRWSRAGYSGIRVRAARGRTLSKEEL
jgi:hypothetical protein